MDPVRERSGRSPRLALVAAGLLVLLGVVAFASRSGFGGDSSPSPTPGYVNYAFTAFLILFVLMIPVAFYAFVLSAREGGPGDRRRRSFVGRVIRNLVMVFLFLGAGAGLIYLRHHGHLFNLNTKALSQTQHALSGGSGGKRAYEPTFQWTVFWIAVLLLVGAAVYLYLERRRRLAARVEGLPEASSIAEELAWSIGDAIDDLEAEPDPRRAVIAAYARMESALSRHGLPRQPSETPLEYLRRILLGLTTRTEAVRRLTDLFEIAKFSHHDVDESMKRAAIDALREIRDDLQLVAAA